MLMQLSYTQENEIGMRLVCQTRDKVRTLTQACLVEIGENYWLPPFGWQGEGNGKSGLFWRCLGESLPADC